MEIFADRAAPRLAGCQCTFLADGCDPPMLMVERPAAPGGVADAEATWLVSIASPVALRIEEVVGELRLDLLAEGPPDRILTCLARLVAARAPAGA